MYPIEFFYRSVRRNPDSRAVVHPGGTLTYAALCRAVQAVAAAIQAADPEPGTRVGLHADNHLEHLVAFLGIHASGKTWVPLNPRNARPELNRAAEVTEPTILIVDEAYRDAIEVAVPTVFICRQDGKTSTGGIPALVERHGGKRPGNVNLPLDATAAIKFTGGSTGLPKGVMQPYRAWNANIVSQIDAIGLDASDVYLVSAPITHGTGTYIFPTLAVGGTILLLDRTRPADILDAFAERGATTSFMPPTLIYMLLQEPGVADRAYPSLRHLIYGGAPMRPESIRAAQAVFGNAVETTFGQTEAPQIMTYLRGDRLAREETITSVGRECLMTEVAIMSPEGDILDAGETGEIVGRGDLLMTGYWKQPDKTAETIVDGWLHTGDVGYLDERGFLFIKDRLKDMIITGGFNVYPVEVENALGRHPAVADCAVFGVEHAKWGEAVHAAVQLRAGRTATEQELIAFVKGELGSVKAPKAVHFYDELPKTPVGKTSKPALKDAARRTVRNT